MQRFLLTSHRAIILIVSVLLLALLVPAVDAALHGPDLISNAHAPHHHPATERSSPGQAHHCDLWSNPAFTTPPAIVLPAPASLPVVLDDASSLVSSSIFSLLKPPRSA